MQHELKICESDYDQLKKHLFPGDGLEAVAVALCGRYNDEEKSILLIHEVVYLPYEQCSREIGFIKWPTSYIHHFLEKLTRSDMAILKIHCHPGGYDKFSDIDDKSDTELFDSVFGWSISDNPHGSAVMLPDGSMFARVFLADGTNLPISKISVIGSQLTRVDVLEPVKKDEFARRTIQAFGERTYGILKQMRIGVVGCSGTGSIVVEQLARLGTGELILIDPDLVEEKNVNRILHSTLQSAEQKQPKVDLLEQAISRIGLNTQVVTFQANIYNSMPALQALCKCDLIFGCMDSVDGRYLLNQLATYFLVPYIDMGVKLEADGQGGINKICGSVNFLKPGSSSLLSRKLYTIEDVKAAGQFRKNEDEYNELAKNSYIKNINVSNPAVISVNMQIASHAINEFLNRLHPFKGDAPDRYAMSTIDITEGYIQNTSEQELEIDAYLKKKVGRGTVNPFLDTPELSDELN